MTKALTLAVLLLAATSPEAQDSKKKEVPLPADSIYALETKSLEGQPAPLKEHAGKVALFVNVASKCGNTKQYTGLEKMYQELKDKGFVILGFPSNDFGGQEPGTPKEIREFCSTKYTVSFPLYEKVVTKSGGEQSPVYAALSKGAGGALPEWNFGKYLVGKDGKVIKYYKAGTKPDNADLLKDIQAALAAK
jgi:glutathione peroxidase